MALSPPMTTTTTPTRVLIVPQYPHNPGDMAAHDTPRNSPLADDSNTAWRFPTPDEVREELAAEFTNEQKDYAWNEAAEAVKTYHDELVRRWKEEMDTLLVYAGLFSAVLTVAFNVQSYQLLQPGPSDSTIAVLREISAQLSSFTISPPFVNSTRYAASSISTQPPFDAPASAVWLNTLWFSSLVLSLSSALIALFVKQWLHEANVQGTSRESARLRQYRLQALSNWRVGTIVVALPIILQLASVLFLSGMLVLLWTLHFTVAAVTSCLVGLFFGFFLTVTILPVVKSNCSYRSPASFAIYTVLRYIRNGTMSMNRRMCRFTYQCYLRVACGLPTLDRLRNFAYVRGKEMPTWRGRDQNEINAQVGALDRSLITTAYSITADTKFVSYMPMIFSDLPQREVAKCVEDVFSFIEAEWGKVSLPDRLYQDPTALPLCVTYGLRYLLSWSDKGTIRWENDLRKIFYHFYVGYGNADSKTFAELACKSLCQLAVEHHSDHQMFGKACAVLKKYYGEGGVQHTFDTLGHAKSMYEDRLAAWDPSRGYPAFREAVMALYVLVHCVHATVSGRSQLSPTQAKALLAWSQGQFSRAQLWLRNLQWSGLHRGCVALSGDAATIVAFPHIVSAFFVQNLIEPLVTLCSTPDGLALVTEDLVSAIEQAWASAQLAYPDAVDRSAGFVWCSGLDRIDAQLTELRKLIDRRPA